MDKAYIEDGFNLYGLRQAVSNFQDSLDIILDRNGKIPRLGFEDARPKLSARNSETSVIWAVWILVPAGSDPSWAIVLLRSCACRVWRIVL